MADKVTHFPTPDNLSTKPGYVAEPIQAHIAGGPKRLRNHGEHPLSLAYHRGQLQGGIIQDDKGKPKYTSADRYAAGNQYRAMWEAIQASACDSTQIVRISSARTGIGDAQADAIEAFSRVTAILSPVDRQIIQLCAAEWYWPSEAVSKACGASYAKSTIPRLNEALDALVEALIKVKRPRERNKG